MLDILLMPCILIYKLLFYVFKIILYIIKYTLIGSFCVVKYLYLLLKYIVKYLYMVIKYIFKSLYMLLKYAFIGLFKVVSWVYSIIKFIIKIIYRLVLEISIYIYHIITKVGQIVFLIPKYAILGIIFVFKHIGLLLYQIIVKPVIKIKRKLNIWWKEKQEDFKLRKQSIHQFFKDTPDKIKGRFNQWWGSLSFVKNSRNKRDINRKALLIDFNSEDAVRNEKKVRYKYVCKNEDGKVIRGTFDAFSKLDVHSFLLSEGNTVYSIKESKFSRFLGLDNTINMVHIKPKELSFFLTQLSTYLKAGIPLVDSVKILGKQTKGKAREKLFQSIVYELTMGENFSEALFKQGNVYPRLLVNMIRTAEMTGDLPETLDDMAEYYTAIEKNRKQIVSAMLYPSIIFVFAIAIVTFIMVFAIPKFVTIYDKADAQIPAITRFVIDFSRFLQTKGIFVAIGAVAVIILLSVMYKTIKPLRTMNQWILMHIPVVKEVIIYNELTMFTKTLGSLINHNVFITDSMEILSRITNNEIYKMLILDTVSNLARGESISNAFKGHWAFPETAYQMLVTGERTGQLGPMMNRVAEYYQEQQVIVVNQIKSFIEPIMICGLAVVVGGILLSVVLPMFNLYSSLTT